MTQDTTKDNTETQPKLGSVEDTSKNVDTDSTDETMQSRKRRVLPEEDQMQTPSLQIANRSTRIQGKVPTTPSSFPKLEQQAESDAPEDTAGLNAIRDKELIFFPKQRVYGEKTL